MIAEARAQSHPEAGQDVLLCNGRVAVDAWHTVQAAVHIGGGRVESILPGFAAAAPRERPERVIDVSGQLLLPGLVNTHDHLHLGIFPRLGRGPYSSWREWARDIYKPLETPLRELLDVPKPERLWWGALRNALAGVTTVCHHDNFHPILGDPLLPAAVPGGIGWAHSLDDPDWMERYAQTPLDRPFIVHLAEGTGARSRREAFRLARALPLDNRIALVHAVGVPRRGWDKLQAASSWVIWCPSSNMHILGKTLPRDLILNYPYMALGSDSPISADGDLLDEIHFARRLLDLPPDLIYRMVTERPARLLRLTHREGEIKAGGTADLLIVRDRGLSPCQALTMLARTDISAVMRGGSFSLVSAGFAARLDAGIGCRRLSLECHGLEWLVPEPPSGVTLSHMPPGFRCLSRSPADMTIG